MILLPCYRKPFHDEFMHGWIIDLAEMCFPGYNRGPQQIIDFLFPYSKHPSCRGVLSKGQIRKDILRGIDKSIKGIKEKGYPIPTPEMFINNNTILAADCICRTQDEQAKYLHTALAEVKGDVMDMPAQPSIVEKIMACPFCIQESPYIRAWHQLEGVKVCAKHGCQLLEVPFGRKLIPAIRRIASMGNKDIIYNNIESETGRNDLEYAVYAKNIYTMPSQVNLKVILKYLMESELITVEDFRKLNKRRRCFKDIVSTLVKLKVKYLDLISFANKEIDKHISIYPDCKLINKSQMIGLFRCERCGNEWTDSIIAVDKLGCPKCWNNLNSDQIIHNALKSLGDGQYQLTEQFKGMGKLHSLLHKTCGRKKKVSISRKIWSGYPCRCETAIDLKSIDRLIEAEKHGFEVSGYIASHSCVTLKHLECGMEMTGELRKLKNGYVCRHCKKNVVESNWINKMCNLLGKDYQVVKNIDRWTRRYLILHIICGQTYEATYTSTRNGARCPLCTPYLIRRNKEQTYESKLFIEMKAWFDNGHCIWVTRRHRKEHSGRKYYDSLKLLVNRGYIYRIDFGIYSNNPDVSIYDVLREKYLIDDDGSVVGCFTGETASYLKDESDEPHVISLETKLLKRTQKSYIHIRGRKVIVKGIPDQ